MAIQLWQLAVVAFPVIAITHLLVSPFTKVEESFNIQAIHDILEYGLPTSDAANKFRTFFDHMTFPGAVPRTFIGSLILSGLAKPEIWISDLAGKASQLHVRAVLGAMNGVALVVFAHQVRGAFGPITAAWYVVLQASQFHVWYYASRTLPNTFAFFMSTLLSDCDIFTLSLTNCRHHRSGLPPSRPDIFFVTSEKDQTRSLSANSRYRHLPLRACYPSRSSLCLAISES